MASQVFYRKWRSQTLSELVGQSHVTQTLLNALKNGNISHAYLFCGPRGTGKTSTARILAKAVNCLTNNGRGEPCNSCVMCRAIMEDRAMDVIEIDAASNRGIDDIRDLREKVNYAPAQARRKVYIIDEFHMLSKDASNALLKTLEEPPPHAIFILATTEVHKIPATVLSRCQRHEFRRIPLHLIVSHLKELAVQEKINVDEEALTLIARQATGSMRDAISLLDQLASSGIPITLEAAQTVLGTATSQVVVELVDTVLQRDPASGLVCIHRALDSGSDPRQFARQVVDYLRNLLLVRLGNADQVDATAEQRTAMTKQAQSFEKEHLLETLRLFNGAASEIRSGWQPGLPLELALAHAIGWREVLTGTPEVIQPAAAPPAAATPRPTHPTNEPFTAQTPIPAADPQANAGQAHSAAQSDAAEASADNLPPGEGHPTPAGIRDNWAKIRAVVKRKQPMIEALLNSCKSVELREGVLQLSFGSPVLKAKMEKDDNLQIVSSAVKQVLGWDIPVTCIDAANKGGQIQSNSDVDADGMVNAALNLGGKIVQKE